jgi:hypothetical protein
MIAIYGSYRAAHDSNRAAAGIHRVAEETRKAAEMPLGDVCFSTWMCTVKVSMMHKCG